MIDLRSDVKTLPTEQMRKAMAEAEVGDESSGEDPTVKKLERRVCEITGKEAALFVTSGTQGNLVSLLSLTQPGQELITDELAHVAHFEAGGFCRIAGLMPRLVPNVNGCMNPADVARVLSAGSSVQGPTGVVVMENTHNLSGGIAVEPERMQAIAELAWDAGARVHVDGARIFNAAVALGRPVSDFTRWCDTITFCFSKSLGAPVGSVICSTADVIERAKFFRKMLGGAMRQSGHLAAAALVALDTMVDRLAEDHDHAKRIAHVLADLPGVEIDLQRVQTNMVFFALRRDDMTAEQFCQRMREKGILIQPPNHITGLFRFVTHSGVSAEDVEVVCAALKDILGRGQC